MLLKYSKSTHSQVVLQFYISVLKSDCRSKSFISTIICWIVVNSNSLSLYFRITRDRFWFTRFLSSHVFSPVCCKTRRRLTKPMCSYWKIQRIKYETVTWQWKLSAIGRSRTGCRTWLGLFLPSLAPLLYSYQRRWKFSKLLQILLLKETTFSLNSLIKWLPRSRYNLLDMHPNF